MKTLKFILTLITAMTMLLSLCPYIPVSAEAIQPTELNGVNTERRLNYLIVYTDEYESGSTGTDDKGIEAIVNKDGVVTAVVISGSSTKKTYIEKNIKVGYLVSLDEQDKTIIVIPEGYTPFSSSTIEYNSFNTIRYENTLIIYDGSNGKTSTGSNEWGYEVVVNSDGFIVSLGGNNNKIPEGGIVLSAIGTKKAALTEIAKIGMSVEIDKDSKIVTISYSKKNAVESPRLILENKKSEYNEAKSLYKNLDYTAIQNAITELENEYENIKTAIDDDNMLSYTVSQNRFDEISANIKSLLVESPAVEGRAIWIRPIQKTEDAVKKTVKAIYDYGFNIICIETLYNNTLITPMPEESLLVQNPDFNGFDVLAAFVTECHKYGIEVHSWLPVYRVAHGSSTHPQLGLNVKKPEWLNISNTGINYIENNYGKGYFLNPALPEVREYLLSVYTRILENYSIDGLQLDYIRYPDLVGGVDYGYDEYTCSLFKEQFGTDPKTMSSGGQLWKEWVDFRAKFVTDFVLEIKSLVEQKRPDIYLACDVAPSYSESLSRMKQDTEKWIGESYIDIVYPMAYGPVDRVSTWTKATVSKVAEDVFTYIGVGDYGADTLFDQISIIRENRANGVAFFAYDQFVSGDYGSIPATIFARRAISPTYCGKKATEAQLKYIKNRIENVIVPSKAEGSSELGALCDDIDTVLTKLATDAPLSECKSELDGLRTSFASVLEKNVKDKELFSAIDYDIALLGKIIENTKDDEKLKYYINHPLPEMYELSDSEESAAINNSEPENSDVELSRIEKIFQGVLLVVIVVPILGLPLYFILDARRKRLLKEFNDKNSEGEKPADDDNDKTE